MGRPTPFRFRRRSARWVIAVIATLLCVSRSSFAQDLTPAIAPPIVDAEPEREGLLDEPDAVRRAVVIVDRRYNSNEATAGLYTLLFRMIPSSGWLSGGLGYRRWYSHDRAFFDTSGEVSWRAYKRLQGRFELPRFAHGRLRLGTQARWQDYTQIDYFGEGPDSSEADRSEYRLRAKVLGGYAVFRPFRRLDISTQLGWMQPQLSQPTGPFERNLPSTQVEFPTDPTFLVAEQPDFLHAELAATFDNRNYPGHPTAGGIYFASIAQFEDQGADLFKFHQYEAEGAQFQSLGKGVVLALHGWVVGSTPADGQFVPFYLQPSVGGNNTLRAYHDFRFHDYNSLVVNAEVRVPLTTHIDGALFADLGNVAPRFEDLNLDKRNFGVGLRLHTTRTTFGRLDVAHGDEGWAFVIRLGDPLNLVRLTRQTISAPFVP